jgi:mono/diheme cytochrome c family protein
MRKAVRIVVWTLAVLVAIAGLLAVAANFLSQRKYERKLDIKVAPVAYVDTPEAIERGRYLFESRGCAECHGSNGAGRVFIDDGKGFRVKTPNITRGTGGVVANYKEVDWVRAIRHGVKPDGRPIMIMPCEDYNRLTDVDLAALVAYTRRLPPAEGTPGEMTLPLIVKALYAAGQIKDAPEHIDHSLPPARPVAEGVNLEHGGYVANLCFGCHGPKLTGGRIPGSPPDWPPAADLTGGSAGMKPYDNVDKFKAMFRSGKAPDGRVVQVMPFPTLKQMNDTDVEALYLYLKSLPARRAAAK